MARVAVAVLFSATLGSMAEARTEREIAYRPDQIWTTALRYLRVDLRLPILEKDKEAGYLLFEYRDRGRPCQATLELVPTVRDGRGVVKATLNIESMPSYVEVVVIEGLLRKLRADFGDPLPARPVTPEGSATAKPADKPSKPVATPVPAADGEAPEAEPEPTPPEEPE